MITHVTIIDYSAINGHFHKKRPVCECNKLTNGSMLIMELSTLLLHMHQMMTSVTTIVLSISNEYSYANCLALSFVNIICLPYTDRVTLKLLFRGAHPER